MLTSKQRAYLKSVAQTIDPAFQVGKGGISPELTDGIARYLKAHEIIKVKILENALTQASDIAAEIALATDSEVVIVIGSKAVLFKKNPENPVISRNL